MWYRFLAIALLFPFGARAINVYADALVWQVSETIDWCLTNDLQQPNQTIAYNTIKFDFEPGFRVGIGYQDEWEPRLWYTWYNTHAQDATQGNVTPASLAGKFAQAIYQSGQANFTIHFNMFDGELAKSFMISEAITLRALIGLRGGWINQRVVTSFQNPITVIDQINNNFRGFGPKMGIEGNWLIYCSNNCQVSLVSHVATSFMWGSWTITDLLQENVGPAISVNVGKRDIGASAIQSFLGFMIDYKGHSLKIGYEVADWFNQYQVLDDATGAHNNDLVLQGLTIALLY